MNPGVCFETKCYEKDWRFLLEKGRLQQMVEHCNYAFSSRILMINNVNDLVRVRKAADKLVEKNVIDKYYVAEEYAARALQAFDIKKESFAGGYYYSIAELVSILLCDSAYLLHFSSDSMMIPSAVNWIDSARNMMEHRKDILVANPVWDKAYKAARNESSSEDEEWYFSQGFSDQCYLVNTAKFREPIYNETNPVSERYPVYGGNLFEKRVDAYMRNHNLLRITSKTCSYRHRNFPKSAFGRMIKLYFS